MTVARIEVLNVGIIHTYSAAHFNRRSAIERKETIFSARAFNTSHWMASPGVLSRHMFSSGYEKFYKRNGGFHVDWFSGFIVTQGTVLWPLKV